MRLGLIFAALCVLTVAAGPHGESRGFGDDLDWWNDLDGAIAEMKAQGKPGFVLIHKSWCGACKHLKKSFENGASSPIRNEAENFVMVNLQDDEEPKSPEFSPNGAGYIPRGVFVNSKGEVQPDIVNKFGNSNYPYFYSDSNQIFKMLGFARGIFNDNSEKEL
eukprot:CAMPEP_0119118408 /NCGR_PEP_ID=MMETSP1310-20130426/306_1 /TAXON_ID=464262 /ORGANISM="Genus nov. species nov., Strain RCC2339" /LENGTH=162 /DNA_ID=CAMNT_0007107771 /DNA_START=55 /DNA_END=543 /DNA_ORIENTATION=-